jgi:predicted nucleic acid-binding protein
MRIFLDSPNWIASAFSRDGGSAALLRLAEAGLISLITTPRVLAESEQNILSNPLFNREILISWYSRVRDSNYVVIPDPTTEEEAAWKHLTVAADTHVLAGAFKGNADVLITFDRKHLLRPEVITQFPIPIQHTATFFDTHPDLREWIRQNPRES